MKDLRLGLAIDGTMKRDAVKDAMTEMAVWNVFEPQIIENLLEDEKSLSP